MTNHDTHTDRSGRTCRHADECDQCGYREFSAGYEISTQRDDFERHVRLIREGETRVARRMRAMARALLELADDLDPAPEG